MGRISNLILWLVGSRKYLNMEGVGLRRKYNSVGDGVEKKVRSPPLHVYSGTALGDST